MLPDDDLDGDLGRLDVVSMDEIRSAFTGLDGLVERAGFPNLADPAVLEVRFSDGIGDAEDGRFDITEKRGGSPRLQSWEEADNHLKSFNQSPADSPTSAHTNSLISARSSG